MCNIFNWISPSLSHARQTTRALRRAAPRRSVLRLLPFGCFFLRQENSARNSPSVSVTPRAPPAPRTSLVADGTCNYFLVPCGLSRCKISSRPAVSVCALRASINVWVRPFLRPHAVRAHTCATRLPSFSTLRNHPGHPLSLPPPPRIISWLW